MKTQGQILPPAAQHRVDRGIVPDVGAVAAMLAEFNHVEVRRRSDPVDKDQLMLGPIKRSHPEAAHGSVPTLDVSVGDAIQPVGKDVAGDCCQPVVGVRESEYTCIKGKCVGQQEAVQERSYAPRCPFRDEGGQLAPFTVQLKIATKKLMISKNISRSFQDKEKSHVAAH